MGYIVDNAIIMAAGLSSRFAPISYETPKPLIKVRGEVLIERQIQQLLEKNITDIIVVAGYKQEQFEYLRDKYQLTIIENKDYLIRNNHSSIYAAREYLNNTYVCSADDYFLSNPFEQEVDESYYAALFASEETKEWCLQTDENDYIIDVKIGGSHQWYMLGHAFWSERFSQQFIRILEREYDKEETKSKLWEDIYAEHLHHLKMKIRRYDENQIFEFDSLDDLRLFDHKYKADSGSMIMDKLAKHFHCLEMDITDLKPIKSDSGNVIGVMFSYMGKPYQLLYDCGQIISL